jgi:hypothetical protein
MALRFLNSGYFAGSVGIGTESPSFPLHVDTSNDVVAYFKSSDNKASIGVADNDTTAWLSAENGRLGFGPGNGASVANITILQSNYNVGIGTTSPSNKLDVNGTFRATGAGAIQGRLSVGTSSSSDIDMLRAGGNYITATNAAGVLYFRTVNDIRMSILANGNVGIGTTNPNHKLTVNAPNNTTAVGIDFPSAHFDFSANSTSGYNASFHMDDGGMDIGHDSTARSLNLKTGNLDRVTIKGDGNVGIGTTTPDHKLDVDGNIGLNQYLYKNGDNDHYIRYTGSKTEIQSPSTIDFRLGANSQPQGGDFQFASDSGDDFTISYTRTGNAVFKQIFSGQAMHWQNNVLDTVYYANNNGNVGIGTTTPGAKLQVGTRGTAGALTPSATDGILFDFHNDGPPYTRHAAIISQAGDASESVIDFWTKEASGTNSKKMTLRGNGNVGIGTASPNSSVKLQVEETGSNAYIRIVETGNTGLDIGQETNGNGIINLRDNKDLRLFTNGSERMRILANGTTLIGSTIDFSNGNADDLQIGNTAGSHGLSIMSQNNAVGSIYFGDNNNNDSGIINYEHGLNQLRFVTNRTQKMVINSSGNVGIGTTSPSEKLDVAGNIKIQAALLSNQDNTDVDTGTETVANVAIATYTAAFFDFVIKKGTNVRSGTVYACHDGTNVEFTETSTQDLGNTSDVTLSVDISGTNMRLRATSLSESWSVKSLIRAI